MDPLGSAVMVHFLDEMEEKMSRDDYECLLCVLFGEGEEERESRTREILKKCKTFRKWILRRCLNKLLL